MRVSLETSCPWLAVRWNRELRGTAPSEDNSCYLWEEVGVPPDVVQYCAGLLPWHGERFVPVPVETQWAICLTPHYGGCRWLRERQWLTHEPALICPLLGSRADRQHKYLYPCALNACHGRHAPPASRQSFVADFVRSLVLKPKQVPSRSKGTGGPVSAEKQKLLCLTRNYVECELYHETLPVDRG
ncbi:MAG: hypothetical protein HY675_06625 [Chloroflexi bacterium]|nr:hypothetical protein [Chloroflexota bacterium]